MGEKALDEAALRARLKAAMLREVYTGVASAGTHDYPVYATDWASTLTTDDVVEAWRAVRELWLREHTWTAEGHEELRMTFIILFASRSRFSIEIVRGILERSG